MPTMTKKSPLYGRSMVREDLKRHRRNVNLADGDIKIAEKLGGGNVSKGLRIALSYANANRGKFQVEKDKSLPPAFSTNEEYPFTRLDVISWMGNHYRVIQNYGTAGQVKQLFGHRETIEVFFWDFEGEKATRV